MADASVFVHAALRGWAAMLALAVATWIVSVVKRDASIVDSVWSILIVLGAFMFLAALPTPGPRVGWLTVLAALWAARLAGYITWRNWGEPEDHRYRAIRARNEPHFALKSLWLVFLLQAVLAAIVALPLQAAYASDAPANGLDFAGIAVCAFGIVFEAIGDWQLARFKADPANKGRVMDRGLWRYTRHPNYFGEFCTWWGFWLIAVASGGWWTIASPLLMSALLLRVSGVALLEKDIGTRRPDYREYVERTSAFWPRPPKEAE
jgi:steroid 5-alpha reductase family enzyme